MTPVFDYDLALAIFPLTFAGLLISFAFSNTVYVIIYIGVGSIVWAGCYMLYMASMGGVAEAA